jgi:hypothetical protein
MSQYEAHVIKLLTQIVEDLRWIRVAWKSAIAFGRKRMRIF